MKLDQPMRLRWLLVVIDASERFACHVWRYVSRSIEFGSPQQWGNKKTLTTDDGQGRFTWWRADEHFSVPGRLGETGEQYEQRVVVLDRDGLCGSTFKRVFEELKHRVGEDQIYVVSATKVGVDTKNSVRLLPRTQGVLEMIQQKLPGETCEMPGADLEVAHVLITGAGFEIRAESIGLPGTGQVLAEVDAIGKAEVTSSSFPVPSNIAPGYIRLIKRAARAQLLDEYWNLIFESKMESVLKKIRVHRPNSNEEKVEAAQSEVELRAAFRESIMKYDWGQLEQCLAAAKCGWHAWLTTNYTHFVDRAIARTADPKKKPKGRWRIISTPAEAEIAELELSRAEMAQAGRNSTRERLLFRLHGDISDLHTMAIAGHDKDPLSPLNVRVESLGAIYEAAERYLFRSLIAYSEIYWHIVGHSLADNRLLELLKRVRDMSRGEHTYRFVAPHERDIERQQERLRWALSPVSGVKFENFQMTAAQYMARLSPDWRCSKPT